MFGIIIINYNQYKLTEEFLESLAEAKNSTEARIYVVDVSTKKETIDFSKYDFKSLIMEDKPNKGYAYGVNVGVRHFMEMGISNYCVLNNDIFIDKNFLIEVEKSFLKYDIFGGKIYYAPGFEYHQIRYSKDELGKVFWYAGGLTDWKNAYTVHRGVDEVDHGQYDRIEQTDFITGCLFCFNKKVWDKVGPWDEKYFLYFEDGDYCERAKRKGFRLMYNPKIVIWHKTSQSTGGSGSSLHMKYQEKNRVIFGLKYAPLRTKVHIVINYLKARLKNSKS